MSNQANSLFHKPQFALLPSLQVTHKPPWILRRFIEFVNSGSWAKYGPFKPFEFTWFSFASLPWLKQARLARPFPLSRSTFQGVPTGGGGLGAPQTKILQNWRADGGESAGHS